MTDQQSTERDLEREGRRLERLRLVALQQQPEGEAEEEFDPDPLEAA